MHILVCEGCRARLTAYTSSFVYKVIKKGSYKAQMMCPASFRPDLVVQKNLPVVQLDSSQERGS